MTVEAEAVEVDTCMVGGCQGKVQFRLVVHPIDLGGAMDVTACTFHLGDVTGNLAKAMVREPGTSVAATITRLT